MKTKAVGSVPNIVNIGECIYCGSKSDLTREHIVPYGLGGPWILNDGSCKECAKISSAFEQDVLKTYLKEPRSALGLPTYRKKNKPLNIDLKLEIMGNYVTKSIPTDQYPPLIIMPHFKVPAYVGNYDFTKGIFVVGASLHGHPDIKEKLKEFEASGFSVTQNIVAVSFARMLAKIAYGMTILKLGKDAFEEVYVLPCILGVKEDVGRWVGCSEEPALVPKVEKLLHRIELITKDNLVSVNIRLFANYKTPVYKVVVGKLK